MYFAIKPSSFEKDRSRGAPVDGLLDVGVVVDVVDAVAVVACTLGAVTELQSGIGGIRAAADRALVTVALSMLLTLRLPHIVMEFGGLSGAFLFGFRVAADLGGEEEEEVCKRDQGDHGTGPDAEGNIEENVVDEKTNVQNGNPTDLDGNDEIEHDLRIGIKAGKGQKQREI